MKRAAATGDADGEEEVKEVFPCQIEMEQDRAQAVKGAARAREKARAAAEPQRGTAAVKAKEEVKVREKAAAPDPVAGQDPVRTAGRSNGFYSPYFIKEAIIMPGYDRTGPDGMGPMTGGRRGVCQNRIAGNRQTTGRGMGLAQGRRGTFGRGGGRGPGRGLQCGFGRGYYGVIPADNFAAGMSPTAVDDLRAEATMLKSELDAINRQIEAFEKKNSDAAE